jgi:hypothetical protein
MLHPKSKDDSNEEKDEMCIPYSELTQPMKLRRRTVSEYSNKPSLHQPVLSRKYGETSATFTNIRLSQNQK